MKWRQLLIGTSLALLAACANVRTGIDAKAVPDGATSVVFGRSLFKYQDRSQFPYRIEESNRGWIINHVSPYTGDSELTRSKYVPGKWALIAYPEEGGYFAADLPPGKYYFVEYGYFDQPAVTSSLFGFRSYMSIELFDGRPVADPFITVFEVVPGKATYIGTMRHFWAPSANSKELTWEWDMRVLDESAAARKWFQQTYPRWGGHMITRLADARSVKMGTED